MLAVHRIDYNRKKNICGSCWTAQVLDRNELAIHKETGMPRGRISPEAMKFLDPVERQLLFEASGNNPTMIRRYIAQGLSPDTYDENRTSPLHIAARYGSIEVIKELILQRATLDIPDCAGWTCLHVASYCGRADVVSLLLESGSDATIVNRRGETPWDLAVDQPTQAVFVKYWQERVEEDEESPMVIQERPQHEISAHSAFNRSISGMTDDRSMISVKSWIKLGNIPMGVLLVSSKELLERGKRVFNNNSAKGLSFFVLCGIVPQDPLEIAKFLHDTELSPVKIGELLGEPQEFNKQIAKQYLEAISFEGENLLQALTKLLSLIKLPRDGIMTDQILEVFAETYKQYDEFNLEKESLHHLALSIVMLDFSLHDYTSSPLSKEEFVNSMTYEEIPSSFLSWIYNVVEMRSIRSVFEEKIQAVFEEVRYTGHLAYKANGEWKERYFVMSDGILWYFFSTTQVTPYGMIPLSGLQVHFDTRLLGFIISGYPGFNYVKFSEDGSLQIQNVTQLRFKSGNLKLWLEAFQKSSNIKLTIR